MPNATAARASMPRRTLRARLLAPALGLLAAGAALTAAPDLAQAQTKFAVVDMRRAILETEEGLRVQATLKKLFDSRQVELDNKQRQLLQEKEDLDKDQQSGKASKEALQRRAETWQRQAAELQTLMVEYQKEMQRKESEMTTPILAKVVGLLKRIAAQDGYEMVLEKSAVPYFRSDLEITDRAIQMYNSGQAGDASPAKGDKKAPAPKAPAAPPAKKDAPKK